MSKVPEVRCNGWEHGSQIPVIYTARVAPNIPLPEMPQPENKNPEYQFLSVPADTRMIALVVHDVMDGEPVNGVRPGWTHYTALYSPEGLLLCEGETSEESRGWVGPYPEEHGEYHCTAYFLSKPMSRETITRTEILKQYELTGLATANIVGLYTNPTTGFQH